MTEVTLTLTPSPADDNNIYHGQYDAADYSVQEVAEILEDRSYLDADTKSDVYEQAYNNSPKDFAHTFSVIERMRDRAEVDADNYIDEDGNEQFIASFRNAYGSGLNFDYSKGKLTIDNIDGMTFDQYSALAQFCWMNNLSVNFPDGIDEYFKNQLNQELEVQRHSDRISHEEPSPEEFLEGVNVANSEQEAENAAQEAAQQLPEEERPDFLFQERQRRAEERMETQEDITKADEAKIKSRMKTFMRRIGKQDGESVLSYRSLWSGDLVYRFYKNAEAAQKDGKMKKGGGYEKTYDAVIRFKTNKQGKLSISYGTPDQGPLPAEYADEIVGIMKSNGNNYIRFKQPMHDKDKGTFREVCARNGVIPLGFNLSEQHAEKMINAAAGALSEKDLLAYKERMAKQLRRQLQNQNIDFNSPDNRLKKIIDKLEGEVKYKGFNDAYAGISAHIHSVVRSSGEDGRSDAVKVIGAANAFCEFYDAYKEHSNSSVKDFLNSGVLNLPEEREAFLRNTGLSPDDSTPLMKLPAEHLVEIYKAMINEQERKAEIVFQRQFSNPNREEKDSDFVASQISNARMNMSDKANDLAESGGGKIYIENLGTPKYRGPVVARGRLNNMQQYRQRGGR